MLVSREGNLVTLINVFETKPEQQQALIDQWIRFTESVKDEPGMIVWRCTEAQMAPASSTTRNGDPTRRIPAL